MIDLDYTSLVCIIAVVGTIGYFIGWMNGNTDGQREILAILEAKEYFK